MPRKFSPKVLTANDLLEGDVIYMAADKSWVRSLEAAKLFTDEHEAQEALKQTQYQANRLVGAYLADAQFDEDGKPSPVHFREAFRATGPSNHPDHGKQAE